MNDYIAAILFFLPAAFGNVTPVFLNKIPFVSQWNTPMDLGKSWRGKRILGDNKRLRGLVFGTFIGGVTALVVSKLNANTVVTIAPFWIGSLLALGALLGDAVESFFKRQLGIRPGHMWFPLDQLDYIIGGLALTYPLIHFPLWAVVAIVLFYFGLHLVMTYIGYLLGLRDRPI